MSPRPTSGPITIRGRSAAIRLALVLAVGLVALLGIAGQASAHIFLDVSTVGIQRAENDGTSRATIVPDPGGHIENGAIAADDKHVYFTTLVSTDPWHTDIVRTDLDGTDQTTVVTNVRTPDDNSSLTALAVGSGHLCWLKADSSSVGTITCVPIDDAGNAGPKQVLVSQIPSASGLAVGNDRVYWGEAEYTGGASRQAIGRAMLDGSAIDHNFIPGVWPQGLAVNSQRIYWGHYDAQTASPQPSTISSAPIDGGAATTIITLPALTRIYSIEATDTDLWWSQQNPGNAIGHAAATGAGANSSFITGLPGVARTVTTEHGTDSCVPSLDFQTSMVATGCFIKTGDHTYKARGSVRIDGIDFQADDESADPIVFDTQKKTVDSAAATFSLSAPGWGSGWFAYHVPGGLHLSFLFPSQTYSYVLQSPARATLSMGIGAGLLGLLKADGFSPTLFGFPAHAPGIELVFTAGHAELQAQISFPTASTSFLDPTKGAFIDPINGLWKVPDGKGGSRISYPTAVKVKASADNTNGVSFVEGTFSPSAVYGIDTAKDAKSKIVWGQSGAPGASVVELAKLRLGWELAKGVVHTGAVLVIHTSPADNVKGSLVKALGESRSDGFFIGRKVIDVDMAWTWWKFNAFGGSFFAPMPTDIAFSVNSINRLIFPEAAIFWQRISGKLGWDLSDPNVPFRLGAGAGFTFLPRFKHDFLWFQEAAALDVTGEMTFAPFSIAGSATFKVANVTLNDNAFTASPEGIVVRTQQGFNLAEMVRVPFPLEMRAGMTLSFPSTGGWQISSDGRMRIYTLAGTGRTVWNPEGLGSCFKATAQSLPAIGIYFDGKWHTGGCDSAPFQKSYELKIKQTTGARNDGGKEGRATTAAAAEPVQFTVGSKSKLSAVAIAGASAAPNITITGPHGLHLSLARGKKVGKGAIVTGKGVIVLSDPSDKTTYVIFKGTAPTGRYRVSTLAGSAAIKGLTYSQALPKPKVTTKVATSGCKRTISWTTPKVAGQTLAFSERTSTGSTKPLFTTSKASGKQAITPVVTTDKKHTVVVEVLQKGTPRLTKTIAKLKPASSTPGAIRKLTAKRKGSTVNLAWSSVCGAAAYVVSRKGVADTTVTAAKAAIKIPASKSTKIITVRAYGPTNKAGRAATVKIK